MDGWMDEQMSVPGEPLYLAAGNSGDDFQLLETVRADHGGVPLFMDSRALPLNTKPFVDHALRQNWAVHTPASAKARPY